MRSSVVVFLRSADRKFPTAYCKRAKALLASTNPKQGGKEAHVLELDLMGEEGAAIQAYLLERTGQRSVPNVRLAFFRELGPHI